MLFTVLKVNEQDVKAVEKARKKHTTGIWGYFYSHMQVGRPVKPRNSGTLHDSHLDTSINDGRTTNSGGKKTGSQHRHSNSFTGMQEEAKSAANDNKKYFNINV